MLQFQEKDVQVLLCAWNFMENTTPTPPVIWALLFIAVGTKKVKEYKNKGEKRECIGETWGWSRAVLFISSAVLRLDSFSGLPEVNAHGSASL